MTFTGHEDNEITFEEGAELTGRHRVANSTARKGGYISKDSIMTLLNQENCVGIRYYYGLTDEGEMELVMVGVNADENDQIGEEYACMDMAMPCPSVCGEENILNSDI